MEEVNVGCTDPDEFVDDSCIEAQESESNFPTPCQEY